MPKKFTEQEKAQARLLYLQGDRPEDIAEHIGCSARMVRNWAKKFGWDKELLNRKDNLTEIDTMLNRALKKAATPRNVKNIAMLVNARKTLTKFAPPPKPVVKPAILNAISQDILKKVLVPEYGLYEYQREFLQSICRFRKIIKARQIGFSYGCLALQALLGVTAGRNQLIVSASEKQALIVLGYVKEHMKKLEIFPTEKPTKTEIVFGGYSIIALPNNFRSLEGFNGDLIFDEFHLYHNQRRIWTSVVPSITAVGGSVTICGIPFLAGSFWWEIVEEYKGKWKQFELYKMTIHDAVKRGMVVPGGIDELRELYDSESWAMMFECQWSEDGKSLLGWDLLHEIATGSEVRIWDGQIYCGVDVGRTNDKTAVVNIGIIEDGTFRLLHYEAKKNMPFEQQRMWLEDIFRMYNIVRMNIDETGIGKHLAEQLTTAHPRNAYAKHFTRELKEILALNLLKLCEDKQLILPNDLELLSQLHAVKKKSTPSGQITYDAARDESGHADLFWAVALAVDGLSKKDSSGWEVAVW